MKPTSRVPGNRIADASVCPESDAAYLRGVKIVWRKGWESWAQPDLFGGTSRASTADTGPKAWLNPTPLAVLIERERKASEAIRANPWHGLRFDTLAMIAAKQDRSGVFTYSWCDAPPRPHRTVVRL